MFDLIKGNKGVFALIIAIVSVLFIAVSWGSLAETNDAGYYQVKQAFYTGNMTVRDSPGTYGKWLGQIETYDYADEICLSSDNLDGGDGAETQAVKVAFPNGSADIDIVAMYELSLEDEQQLTLHRKYNTSKRIKAMIRQQILEAVMNTATLMSAEEAYIRKSEFRALAKEQLSKGLYIPEITTITRESNGQTQIIKNYSVKKDSLNNPIVRSSAMLPDFDIKITQFNIKAMVFDRKTTDLIDARREAKKAAQDAITAKAKGEATIATKKAEQEAFKIEEVTKMEKQKAVAVLKAQKDKEVAELNAEQKYNVSVFQTKQAKEKAKKILAEGQAQARIAKLKVVAGLSPQERLAGDIKIADVVSKNIGDGVARTKFPSIMTFGGGKGSPSNPIEALGFKAMYELTKQMSKK